MASFTLPVRPGTKGTATALYDPALRRIYNVVSLIALPTFLFGMAGIFLGRKLPEMLMPWVGPALLCGLAGIAACFTLVALDWLVLSHRVTSRWPRVAGRVIGVQVSPVSTGRGSPEYAVAVQAVLSKDGGEQTHELVTGLQVSWQRRKGAEAFLEKRIVNGHCETALEPAPEGRYFLLPWRAPWAICLFMGITGWVVFAGFTFFFPPSAFLPPRPPARHPGSSAAHHPAQTSSSQPTTGRATPLIIPGPQYHYESGYPVANTLVWDIQTEGDVLLDAVVSGDFIKRVGVPDRESSLRKLKGGKFRVPGPVSIDLPAGLDGVFSLSVYVPGYSRPYIGCFVVGSRQEGTAPLRATLFRKRYAVLRYVVDETGRGSFDHAAVQMRTASEYSRGGWFGRTWDFWQGPATWGEQRSGAELIVRSYARDRGAGIRLEPGGTSFESLIVAPADGYEQRSFALHAGLIFTARANSPTGPVYGKFLIEQVTTDPPPALPKF